jgi:hypothetical protein
MYSPSVAAKLIKEGLERKLSLTLKTLLEEKHLYQSLEVELDEGVTAAVNSLAPQPISRTGSRDFKTELKMFAAGLLLKRWYVMDPSGSYTHSEDNCSLLVPHVKTFCTTCDRIEPFNLTAATDYLDAASHSMARLQEHKTSAGVIQNFVMSFLCQGCKLIPEIFMVRRVGAKLTLCGRSPIEHIEVPKFLPTNARQYFSGAIVAHQSGQTLAGLFLLRTYIEQWIRSLGAKDEYADQALDWYMSTLPEDFRAHFPSLRDIYGVLSDAMHKADASPAIFDKAKADIETHFDARRLRKLSDPNPSAA